MSCCHLDLRKSTNAKLGDETSLAIALPVFPNVSISIMSLVSALLDPNILLEHLAPRLGGDSCSPICQSLRFFCSSVIVFRGLSIYVEYIATADRRSLGRTPDIPS